MAREEHDLKDKALADAVAKQPWDPAVQSMAAFPDAVKRLADDIQWTTDLGNAFLAQQSDVMDAVQRMRKKAKDNDALASSEQQKVETKVIETKEVIVIEPANPEVIYVPSYSPTYVYGPPVYPYPPIYYPPYSPGAAFVSFSMGVMIGAASGRRLGPLRLGPQRHQRQRQQQLQPERQHQPQHQRQPERRKLLAAQRPAPGRSALRRQGHREQVRRHGPRRLALEPPGERGAAAGAQRSELREPCQRGRRQPAAAATAERARARTRGSGGGGGDRIGSREVSGGSSRPSSSSSSRSSGFGSSSGYSGSSARSSSSRGSSSYGGGSRGGGGRGGGGGRRR